MLGRLKPYLQLVRLPNLFTAAADSLAGFLLVGGALHDARGWGTVVTISIALYAAGIVLNDIADAAVDARERPTRPIPSGRVSKRTAVLILGVCLALVAVVALLGGSRQTQLVALLLALAILIYDLAAKHSPFGPVSMGLCRTLNLLLGLSIAPQLGGPVAWLAAASYGLFVAGVTWISRSEVEQRETRGIALGLTIQNISMFGLLLAVLGHSQFPGTGPARPPIPAGGLAVLALIAICVNLASGRALNEPTPKSTQTAVKTGIFCLVWLNAALVLAVRGLGPGLIVAALWIPAYFLGKWIYST